jgi:hypothetical protein
MIILGIYVSSLTFIIMQFNLIFLKYATCDSTLLFQIYYYRWKKCHVATSLSSEDQETNPLLRDTNTDEEVIPLKSLALRYLAALTFVVTVGLMAWWITQNEEDKNLFPMGKEKWWTIQALGWSSALLFVRTHSSFIFLN